MNPEMYVLAQPTDLHVGASGPIIDFAVIREALTHLRDLQDFIDNQVRHRVPLNIVDRHSYSWDLVIRALAALPPKPVEDPLNSGPLPHLLHDFGMAARKMETRGDEYNECVLKIHNWLRANAQAIVDFENARKK